jgi:hypothetical protein
MTSAENGTVAALAGASWRKASFSNPSGNCVELARTTDGRVAVRNSRHPGGAIMIYERTEMEAFLLGAKAGEFDGLLA